MREARTVAAHGRLPEFVGNVVADPHAFAVVNRMHGMSVKVGHGPSCASYRLPNVAAVREWLAALAGDPP